MRLISLVFLVACTGVPDRSGDTASSDVSDGGSISGHHHNSGGSNGGGSGDDTDNGSSDGSESSMDSVCVTFSEGYDKLTLMLESSGDSKWDTPAATVSNASTICSTIAHDTCIKVQVRINDGVNWYDWAAYNDQATRCAWQPYVTTLNGSTVGVNPLPWDVSDGSSPATKEGCDGWIGSCDL